MNESDMNIFRLKADVLQAAMRFHAAFASDGDSAEHDDEMSNSIDRLIECVTKYKRAIEATMAAHEVASK
jgi:hypothetical protein